MGVCTKERKGVAAEALMASPCTNSLGGESEGHKQKDVGGAGLMIDDYSLVQMMCDDDVYYYNC